MIFTLDDIRLIAAERYGLFRSLSGLDFLSDSIDEAQIVFKALNPDANLDESNVYTTLSQYSWYIRWPQFSMPTFQLTHSLTAALILTDCRGIRFNDFKLPYPAILFVIPSPSKFIVIESGHSKRLEPVRFITIQDLTRIENQQTLNRTASHARQLLGKRSRGSLSEYILAFRQACKSAATHSLLSLTLKTGEHTQVSQYLAHPYTDQSIEQWLEGSDEEGASFGTSKLTAYSGPS